MEIEKDVNDISWFERQFQFKISERGSSIGQEFRAGTATFLTMVKIIDFIDSLLFINTAELYFARKSTTTYATLSWRLDNHYLRNIYKFDMICPRSFC